MDKQLVFAKILFGIVLGILIVSFLNVGISLFYPEPKYENYCEPKIYNPESESERFQKDVECSNDYEIARDQYNKIVFLILAPIGLLLLIIGTQITDITLQIMLMGSGFINVVIAIVRNIEEKTSVFITLGILILIGILFTIKKLK